MKPSDLLKTAARSGMSHPGALAKPRGPKDLQRLETANTIERALRTNDELDPSYGPEPAMTNPGA